MQQDISKISNNGVCQKKDDLEINRTDRTPVGKERLTECLMHL